MNRDEDEDDPESRRAKNMEGTSLDPDPRDGASVSEPTNKIAIQFIPPPFIFTSILFRPNSQPRMLSNSRRR